MALRELCQLDLQRRGSHQFVPSRCPRIAGTPAVVQRDLHGRLSERAAAHVLSSSQDKIRFIRIIEMTVLWIMNLELEIIHTLMVEEQKQFATVQVRDDSILAIEEILIVVLDQLADTQDGYLHLHVIEGDTHILAIDHVLDPGFAKFVQETTAGCLSDLLLISL